MENNCYKNIAQLLANDKIEEALGLLEEYLSYIGYSTDFTPLYVAASWQQTRTKKEFWLGTITRQEYNISSHEVIIKALNLADLLCTYIDLSHKSDSVNGGLGGGGPYGKDITKKLIHIVGSNPLHGVTIGDDIIEWLNKGEIGRGIKVVYSDKEKKEPKEVSYSELIGYSVKELVREIAAAERK